ncbi:MAG TPA: PAS domain S-box protein [Caulobacteraceae bacterium]|jgi:PAS domain S-box-containing protein
MDHQAGISSQADDDTRYRLLIDAIHDYAIYMLDLTGHVSSWNPGAQRFKGYEAQDILGRHFSLFYTPEERDAGLPERNLDRAAVEGRYEGEGWRVRRDGRQFWAHVVIDAIRDEDGRLLGFAKITRDVTERRQTQQALAQAQQALFQAQKMESIGQLTGGVAHDFNNLLMAILGSLELVQKRLGDQIDPKTQGLLDNAIQGAQRGASLTRRMLAFARRQELKTEPLALPALVRGMTGLLERTIGPGVRIASRFSPGLPLVLTDANQLEAALMNLVVNARDAMPQGGQILIAAREETLQPDNALGLPPGAYACLSVTDTGAGMDEATLNHAVEPFFTTKGVGKGTGLGLPMVHGLAEQSGGRLRLDSRPGEGTTAEMWLPAAIALTAAPEHAPDAAIRAEPLPRSLTILAVDDDDLVLMNTSAMLEDLGHVVLEAHSGAQALQILKREPGIDLLVTDQVMPNMTGLQLAETAHGLRPDLAVILATGYAELPPGADPSLGRLAKPFTQAELAEAVAQAVERDDAAQNAPGR